MAPLAFTPLLLGSLPSGTSGSHSSPQTAHCPSPLHALPVSPYYSLQLFLSRSQIPFMLPHLKDTSWSLTYLSSSSRGSVYSQPLSWKYPTIPTSMIIYSAGFCSNLQASGQVFFLQYLPLHMGSEQLDHPRAQCLALKTHLLPPPPLLLLSNGHIKSIPKIDKDSPKRNKYRLSYHLSTHSVNTY